MKKNRPDICSRFSARIAVLALSVLCLMKGTAFATQLHARAEGIVTHQFGHLFFLFSMVALIFTITGKDLARQKGWRLIQYAAFFFILWNLDAMAAHFLDNQIDAVKTLPVSFACIKIIARNDSSLLAWFYYALKLDHLLCVPAMIFLYRGISKLVDEQRAVLKEKGGSQ